MLIEYQSWFGIAMLVSVSICNFFCGIAIWEGLIAVSTLFAVLGIFLNIFDLNLLGLLSNRLVGLFESDLFQAIPLYVFVASMLKKSKIADDIFHALRILCEGLRVPQENAYLLFSLIVAPMNGSVASTAHLLNFKNDPSISKQSLPFRFGLICSASTIGLIIPPSLVLLMMGDAMMRAHTEAMNMGLANADGTTIVNTKDIFVASLLPGFLVFSAWVVLNFFLFKNKQHTTDEPDSDSSQQRGLMAMAAIGCLFFGVFQGLILAVEAAAIGSALLCFYFMFLNSTDSKMAALGEVVKESFSLAGSLLTILFAATAFSLVFRLFETDKWINHWILNSSHDLFHLLMIFISVGLCALMMDAFELILVIIPIVSPGLIMLMGDAKLVATLLLLTIQISFLLTPFGYAVLIARNFSPATTMKHQMLSVLPYVTVILVVFICFLLIPSITHEMSLDHA